jgi:hypothetical protein
MRTAFFGTSGQSMAEIQVAAASHDFAVIPFAHLRGHPSEWSAWAKVNTVGLVVHVPCCYMRAAYAGDFYDDWREVADAGGWLLDDDGKPVPFGNDTLLNLRLTQADHNPCVDFGDALVSQLILLYGKVKFDTVFVDSVWDAVSWTSSAGATWKDRIALDKEWKAGVALMLKIVRSGLYRLGSSVGPPPFIVGNGYTTCPNIDCRCIEGFPRGTAAWAKNLLGIYGAAAHARQYREPAWFIPHSTVNKPGVSPTDEDALATISAAAAYYGQPIATARLTGKGPVLGMNSMQDARRLFLA